jgi:hypothetical protein
MFLEMEDATLQPVFPVPVRLSVAFMWRVGLLPRFAQAEERRSSALSAARPDSRGQNYPWQRMAGTGPQLIRESEA